MTPSAKREVATRLEHSLPVQRACRIARLSRTAYYELPGSSLERDAPAIEALKALVERYPRMAIVGGART
jgi:putative transposase